MKDRDIVPASIKRAADMNVLITVPCLDLPGGVANYYRTLRGYLDDRKIYFKIGVRPGEAGVWAAFARLALDCWRFHRVLARRSIDLVHINPSLVARSLLRDGLLLLIAKAHRVPVLVFFRGWDADCEIRIRERYRRSFQLVYGRADALIVLADEFRRTLTELGITAPVYVDTTLVDDTAFEGEAESGPARTNGSCEVLFLGRLYPGKGLPEVVEAFAHLLETWPGTKLRIAGDGPERSAAERTVSLRGMMGIVFLGHVTGAARDRAFRNADIFFFPTFFGEGMPNAVLEAMAFGLPVVTRPVAGLRDFFEDGRMGFVTESADPAVFAELLGRLVADPDLRKTMGEYNRAYAKKRFAASVVAARLGNIYEQLSSGVLRRT